MEPIKYSLTEEDLQQAFTLFVSANQKAMRKWIALPIIAISLAIAWSVIGDPGFSWMTNVGISLIAIGIALPVAIFLAKFSYPVIGRLIARRVFRQQKSLHEELNASWTDTMIMFKSASGHHDLKFTDFVKFASDENVILLYQSDQLFNALYTRFFASEEQAAEFMTLITKSGIRKYPS